MQLLAVQLHAWQRKAMQQLQRLPGDTELQTYSRTGLAASSVACQDTADRAELAVAQCPYRAKLLCRRAEERTVDGPRRRVFQTECTRRRRRRRRCAVETICSGGDRGAN